MPQALAQQAEVTFHILPVAQEQSLPPTPAHPSEFRSSAFSSTGDNGWICSSAGKCPVWVSAGQQCTATWPCPLGASRALWPVTGQN